MDCLKTNDFLKLNMRQPFFTGLLFLVSVIGFQLGMDAQGLQRKASLGIMMQPLNDSLVSTLNLDSSEGLYIMDVAPGGTVNAIGMQSGAVLKRINGKQVNEINDVFSSIANFRAEDDITLAYIQNGEEISKKGKGIAKPMETYTNAEIIYDEVRYEGNVLRSILYKPKNIKNPPIVYFMQGYTCGSIDLPFSSDQPYRRLVHDWVEAGFAVYRIEKPGVGDSESLINCAEINFDQELLAFKEGYKNMLKIKDIDSDNVFMFGHSMGGIIAPLLNQVKEPRGIITYGAGGKRWYDYMIDLYTIQPKHFGVSDTQIKEDNKINLRFNDDLLINKLSGDEMAKKEEYAALFNLEDFERGQYIGRHFKFWQGLADIDIPNAWAQIRTNVLAMHGQFDIQAINEKGAQQIVDIVNKNGGNGSFVLIAKADHGFVNFNSMQHNVETLANGSYGTHMRNNYNSKVSEESIGWMKSHIKS